MPYLGRPVTNAGQFEIIDDISSDFDGSETSFSLKVGGTDIQPDVANVTITLGGVYQVPASAYSITGSTINFSEAPESSTAFHGVLAGQSQFIESDFITNTMIKSTANISGSKINTDFSGKTVKAAIFDGMVSSSAQIADNISGSLSQVHLSSKISGIVSASSIASSAQGQVALTTNGVAATAVDLGLQSGDSPTFAGGTITGDFSVGGTITAQEVHTEFESASVIFTSGSTIFGNSSDDIHNMTGSLNVSGGLDVDGTTNLDVVDIDGAVDMASTLTLGGRLTLSNAGSDPGLFLGDGWQIFDNASESFGTAGDLVFYHGASRMVIGDTGNVGIGTTNPTVALEVFGSADQQIRIDSTGNRAQLQFDGKKTSDAEFAEINFANDGDSAAAIHAMRDGANDAARLAFFTQATGGSVTERMTIDSDGKIGVNTTTMDAHVNINSGATNAGLHVESTDSSANISLADNVGSAALINIGGRLVFETGGTASTAASSGTESMTISGSLGSAGNVGIGTATPPNPLTVFRSDSGTIAQFGPNNTADDASIYLRSNGVFNFFTPGGGSIRFSSGGSEALTLDSSQNATFVGDIVFDTAGKGIVLGNTSNADANTLDDYEEGVWTPIPYYQNASDQSTAAANDSNALGRYVIVGRQITLWAAVTYDMSSLGGITFDNIGIKNLPVSTANITNYRAVGCFAYSGNNASDEDTAFTISMGPNNNHMHIQHQDGTGNQAQSFGNGSSISLFGTITFLLP